MPNNIDEEPEIKIMKSSIVHEWYIDIQHPQKKSRKNTPVKPSELNLARVKLEEKRRMGDCDYSTRGGGQFREKYTFQTYGRGEREEASVNVYYEGRDPNSSRNSNLEAISVCTENVEAMEEVAGELGLEYDRD